MAPTSTPPPAPATCTAHGVGAFFRPAPAASSSDVGIGTLLGGGDTEYIESMDVHADIGAAATTMGADAAPLAGFLGLLLARRSAGWPARCCGEAWRCGGRGRSGGCGNGLQAIIREGDAAGEELLLRDFKPHSICESVFPNLVPKQAADLSRVG